MTNPSLKIFTEHTYTRADFAHDISLTREFFEYIFFTKRDASASKEGIEQFAAYSGKSPVDNAFLRSLPLSFLESFTKESLYDMLDHLTEDAKKLKTLSLTVPVALSRADVEVIGMWAHREVSPDLLIDFDIDPSIAVGCRLVWNNMLRDFSFNRYLIKNQTALHERLTQSMAKP